MIFRFSDREKSWLSFNERVLQEAADETVPLIERIKFLGIFSNNLDEFFRVRYANLRRMAMDKMVNPNYFSEIPPKQLLKEITKIVIKHQKKSLEILDIIFKKLEEDQIFVLKEHELNEEQKAFCENLFVQKISPDLVTIILNDLSDFPKISDTNGYLAVRLTMKKEDNKSLIDVITRSKDVKYALVEMPKNINRFVIMPSTDEKINMIMLDDIIRLHIDKLFNIFPYESISAHMIKITRDAELEFETDLSKSFVDKISESVKERKVGEIVRFVYDADIHLDTLKFLLQKMKIEASDSIIPGGRYHNRRDYMSFPNLGKPHLVYPSFDALEVKDLNLDGSVIQRLKERDFLIHAPYQSFAYLIKFLRELALDPKVLSIKITLYRLAKNSQVISSLINAAKNGKKVTVQIELQARFDEASNISYSRMMQDEGIELIFGVKGLKVHSKVCVAERLEKGKIKRYGFISTGNFNESTAKIYTDYTVLTAHAGILKDASKVFDFFETNYKVFRFKHLIFSPHYTRKKLTKLIDQEIYLAQSGAESFIKLRMNSLTDYGMIQKLYEASAAGVKIQLMVRGMCCLIPGVKGLSENIEAISIVDRFLEHARVFIFSNNMQPKVYISSADFMRRNIDMRVEVSCPIYDEVLKKELIDNFDICWLGNVKVRLHDEHFKNQYRSKSEIDVIHQAQIETYNYYKSKV
jgi:polyphosphate kinase